jgi:hypothetical protein
MNADRWAAVEDLLQAADRPAAVSHGLRCRVLQAASQAHTRRTRRRQALTACGLVVVLFAGVTFGVMQLVQHVASAPAFANWNSPAMPYDMPAGNGMTPASAVPVEWRMVESFSAMQESRSRAFGAGMF